MALPLLRPRLVVEVGASIAAALRTARAVCREPQRVRLLLLLVIVVMAMLVVELLHRHGSTPTHHVVVPKDEMI